MPLYFLIFLGAGLGGMARQGISDLVAHYSGSTFPWSTLIINVSGSFIIGFFATLTAPDGKFLMNLNARQFIMTGILGGYTTYSSFSLQTLSLARNGQWLQAGANATGTVFLCFLAVWLGHVCAKLISTH